MILRTDFDVSPCVKEDIVRLDVSMDDVLCVKMRQALARLKLVSGSLLE